jgi:hypothetical protein
MAMNAFKNQGMVLSFIIVLLAGVMVSCNPRPRYELPVNNLDEFLAALGDAGVESFESTVSTLSDQGIVGKRLEWEGTSIEVYEFINSEVRQEASEKWIGSEGAGILLAQSEVRVWGAGRLMAIYQGTDGGTILLLDALLGEPVLGIDAVGDEPYPPAIAAAIRTLAEREGVSPGIVRVIDFDAVEWEDSCLGYPEIDEVCVDGPLEGWRVGLEINTTNYELHTDTIGQNIR